MNEAAARPAVKIRYWDAHNHLQDEALEPHLPRVTAHLEALPIGGAVVNGTHEGDWPKVLALARAHRWVRPSLGVHPWQAGNRSGNWLLGLHEFLVRDAGIHVGEIGLDRWMLERARNDDPRLQGLRRAPIDEQVDVFKKQLQLAVEFDRAATIHCLDAWGALWEILRAAPLPSHGFLLHAYAGPAEMLPGFLQRGAFVSFNGYFLNERKQREQQVFRAVPLDRLLVETDAPAMAPPTAWRTYKLPAGGAGSTLNHPANIEAAYAGLAALKGVSVSELGEAVEQNFARLFGP